MRFSSDGYGLTSSRFGGTECADVAHPGLTLESSGEPKGCLDAAVGVKHLLDAARIAAKLCGVFIGHSQCLGDLSIARIAHMGESFASFA